MNDGAKSGSGARSWISENGGVVAIIAAIFVVGGVIYQGDRKGEREAVAHIASLQTEIGNRIDSLEDRVINLEGDMGLL